MIVECSSCGTKNRVPSARLEQGGKCGNCKEPLSPPGKAATIESASDFDDLLRASPMPVLVDFWAPWCGPCRAVAPEVERVAKDRQGKVVVAKVNTEDLPEVAGRFGIRAIPTMILFSGGKESKRLQGAMQAPAILQQLAL
jgi:thioredoxin 2